MKDRDFSELHDSLVSWLQEHPGAVNVTCSQPEGTSAGAISSWEIKHGQLLPDDLRDFYQLNNGLQLRWDVVAHGREVMPLGCVAVNPLEQLIPVGAHALENERGELRPELPASAAGAKAFDLDAQCETGRVLLLLGLPLAAGGSRRAQVWFQDGSCALCERPLPKPPARSLPARRR